VAEEAQLAVEAEAKRVAEEAQLAVEAEAKRVAEEAQLAVEAEAKRVAEEAQLAMEAAARVLKAETEAKRATEANQRSLLSSRLEKQEKIHATKREQDELLAARLTSILRARSQPKPREEEDEIASRYGAMEARDRAFNILVDLGMVETTSEPSLAQ
jgi:membrane protein involved in colicin uptake